MGHKLNGIISEQIRIKNNSEELFEIWLKKGHYMHDKYAALVNSNTATTVSNNNNKTEVI